MWRQCFIDFAHGIGTSEFVEDGADACIRMITQSLLVASLTFVRMTSTS